MGPVPVTNVAAVELPLSAWLASTVWSADRPVAPLLLSMRLQT